jgi:hypothetical protein
MAKRRELSTSSRCAQYHTDLQVTTAQAGLQLLTQRAVTMHGQRRSKRACHLLAVLDSQCHTFTCPSVARKHRGTVRSCWSVARTARRLHHSWLMLPLLLLPEVL